jgi:hypothetical protein
MSGRSSTRSRSSLLAWLRATASSSLAKPVSRPKIRSKRRLSAVRRVELGSSLSSFRFQEVQPALRRAGSEPGEAIIADVRGVFLPSGVAGRRVIDPHPTRRRQPGLQEGVLLGVEKILVGRKEGDDVALRNAHAQAFQLGKPALHRHLPLDVLHQDITHDPGADAEGRAKRSGANCPVTSGGNGATIGSPSGVTQRSRR